jgi:hypothetical protein
MSETLKKTLIYGVAAIGIFALWKRLVPPPGPIWWPTPEDSRAKLAAKPVQVQNGQSATLSSYRVIKARRSGLTYAAVTQGTVGGDLTFTMPKAGTVTRNVVVEGGKVLVEVA